jgi:hypothetical protein
MLFIMSILKQAASMRRSADLAAKQKSRIAKKKMAESAKSEQQQRNQVLAMLRKEFGRSKQFKITKEVNGNIYGEIARLERLTLVGGKPTPDYLGTICLQIDRYTWRGSDESPEEEGTRGVLTFQTIVNDSSTRRIARSTDNGLTEAINCFKVEMARLIAEDDWR